MLFRPAPKQMHRAVRGEDARTFSNLMTSSDYQSENSRKNLETKSVQNTCSCQPCGSDTVIGLVEFGSVKVEMDR